MKIACVQMCSGIDRARNVDDAISLIKEAAARGAELVATPEMTNVVDRKASRLFGNLPTTEQFVERDQFAALSKELGVDLLIGSMAVAVETADGKTKMANRGYFFSPDGLCATYDKIHLFDVDLPTGESWKESATMVGGEEAVLIKTKTFTLGLSICYDVRFAHLYRSLAQGGADILAVPAAFTKPTGEAHWQVLLRTRAIETGSFVIAPAQGGEHEDGRVTYGHSLIIDPWGRILAEKADSEPGVILADIDLAEVEDTRRRIPSLGLDRAIRTRLYEA